MIEAQAAKNEFNLSVAMARPSSDGCPAEEWYRSMARGMIQMAQALDALDARLARLEQQTHRPSFPGALPTQATVSR